MNQTSADRFRRGSQSILVASGVTSALLLVASPLALAAYPSPLIAHRYAVATDNADASRVAADVLHRGGNAADGAIAAALALGVVHPVTSGFGGGGFATICSPRGECTFIDFRETSPAALTAAMIQHATDPSQASVFGGLAVGIPGEPRGLLEISRRFGHISMAQTVAPVVRLARQGFPVSSYFADQIVHDREHLTRDPSLLADFVPANHPLAAATILHRATLATTLERYGRDGERFIDGPLAQAIAQTVHASGGVMTADDVRNYRPEERVPLARAFRDWRVVTAPPPSAGGVALLETLAWIQSMAPASLLHGSSGYDHVLAQAWRGAYDDRARYIGDPGHALSNADALLDPARIARRRASFDPTRVTPITLVDPPHDHGTTHVCVVDADGMMVSLTTTINLQFGARLVVPNMGILLNDQIDDFSLGTAGNNWGMAFSQANALVAGRRPVSSMTPTIILRDGRPVGCVGASGGSRIATATTQVLLNMLVFGMDPMAAVSSPRVHDQGVPDRLLVDRDVAEDVRAALRQRGYEVVETEVPLGVSQALWVRENSGVREILAASDPRKHGAPAGE